MKRVLHLTYALDFGGVETHLATLARTHGGRFEHHFCALAGGGAAADAIRGAGGEVTILAAEPWRRPLWTLWRLIRHLRALRPAVVHGHGLEGNLFGMAGALLARVPGRVAEEIGMPAHSAKGRAAVRLAYRIAQRVIAVSDAIAAAIVEASEAPARKVVRIYNPVALSTRQARARQTGEPLTIGFVGRLAPIKNPLALVQAVALLPSELDWRLVLIGDGSERSAIQVAVAAHDLGPRVELLGFRADPTEVLARCHLYVQPSLAEGFGIALVEAMSCGLPVIVSRTGGMPEIVTDGVDGWLLDCPDPDEIADAITNAAAMEPDALARIGTAARRAVEQRFDPRVYLERIEALYDECLGRRAP